jgi:hypothetical protein
MEAAEPENPESAIHCSSCNRTLTRDELIRENGEITDAVVDQIRKEVLEDAAKELRKALEDAFRGSTNIRIS